VPTLFFAGATLPIVFIFGLLLWLPLHFTGCRHWTLSLGLGALISAAVWLWLMHGAGSHPDYEAAMLTRDLAASALIGALFAGGLWRAAYRHAA
jgi:uncharacterized membrane protein